MNPVKIKRPDAINVLRQLVEVASVSSVTELSRMQLHQIYAYIIALENANSQLQGQITSSIDPVSPKAFRAVCQWHWCKRVHYGATQQEAQTNAEQCNHLPK